MLAFASVRRCGAWSSRWDCSALPSRLRLRRSAEAHFAAAEPWGVIAFTVRQLVSPIMPLATMAIALVRLAQRERVAAHHIAMPFLCMADRVDFEVLPD